jgi:hypothetical protein
VLVVEVFDRRDEWLGARFTDARPLRHFWIVNDDARHHHPRSRDQVNGRAQVVEPVIERDGHAEAGVNAGLQMQSLASIGWVGKYRLSAKDGAPMVFTDAPSSPAIAARSTS